jgi:hypothetical protein
MLIIIRLKSSKKSGIIHHEIVSINQLQRNTEVTMESENKKQETTLQSVGKPQINLKLRAGNPIKPPRKPRGR